MAKEGYALLLDCKDLSTKQIPISKINDYIFLITNSNAPHKLSSSAYCQRRDCCYEVAKRLNKKSLREVSMNDIQGRLKNIIISKKKSKVFFFLLNFDILYFFLFLVLKSQNVPEEMIKRTRHVVTEIKRTIDAVEALEKGDLKKFGQLMNESHDSLKNDYEVSSVELDTLVKAAREINGVLGSRLTGAGFGGCTITLLRKDVIDETINHMKTKLDCYFCNIFIIFEFDNDIYI